MKRGNYTMLGTLVRCSVAAVASVALLVAFVITPEGFTQAKKPKQARRQKSEKSHSNRINKKTTLD